MGLARFRGEKLKVFAQKKKNLFYGILARKKRVQPRFWHRQTELSGAEIPLTQSAQRTQRKLLQKLCALCVSLRRSNLRRSFAITRFQNFPTARLLALHFRRTLIKDEL